MTDDDIEAAANSIDAMCSWMAETIEPRQMVEILMRQAGTISGYAGLSREEMYASWVSAFSAAMIAGSNKITSRGERA